MCICIIRYYSSYNLATVERGPTLPNVAIYRPPYCNRNFQDDVVEKWRSQFEETGHPESTIFTICQTRIGDGNDIIYLPIPFQAGATIATLSPSQIGELLAAAYGTLCNQPLIFDIHPVQCYIVKTKMAWPIQRNKTKNFCVPCRR